MNDPVRIPHSQGWTDFSTVPGWWVAVLDGRRVVNLRCGGCKRHAGTLTNHTIEADGRVHASIQCPNCDWHVMGMLVGWGRPRKAPGEEPAPH